MASEIQTTTRLYCANGGAYLPSQTTTRVLNQSGTDMGDATQTITTAAAQVIAVPAGVGGDRYLEIVNLAALGGNYINVSVDNAGTKYVFSKVIGASSILIQPTGAIYATSVGGDALIQTRVCDA